MAMGTESSYTSVDLLEEQRQPLGLSSPQRRPPASELLLRGGAAGLVLVAVVVGLGVMVTRERQIWSSRVDDLAPVVQEHDELEDQLRQIHHGLLQVQQHSAALVHKLTTVYPTSLLLQEIGEQTPQGMQLQELNRVPDGITIKGLAESWLAVNLLQLRLQNSSLFQPGAGVQVKGLLRETANGSAELVNFQLTARLKNQSLEQLRSHGQQRGNGQGFLKRLHLLNLHGLLPPVPSQRSGDQ